MRPLTGSNAASNIDTAIALYNDGRFDDADRACASAIDSGVCDERAWRIRGLIARRQGKLLESIRFLKVGGEAYPTSAKLQHELGNSLREAGKIEESLDAYLAALKIEPEQGLACTNYAATLLRLERYDEAAPWCERAVALNPGCAISQFNLATLHSANANFALALPAYDRTLQLNPQHAQAHWNRAVCLLLNGDYGEGWREFEWRSAAGEVQFDRHTAPFWDGSPLNGRTLLVHAEQGIGDELLFASCLPDVIAERGRVVVACEPRLEALFARSFPGARVVGWRRKKDWSPVRIDEPIHVQIPIGSLPAIYRRDAACFPQRQQFLMVDPEKRNAWRERFATLGDGLKIGISWRAGGKPPEHRRRTIPLTAWGDIFTAADVHFVNLQYGVCHEELRAIEERGIKIHDWDAGDPLVDLDDYAAKVAALDLIISVGNTTVHFGGGLGVPTYALLPKAPSWRWTLRGDRSPWYKSVRLFRQSANGDWTAALTKIGERLTLLARRPCKNCIASEIKSQNEFTSSVKSVDPAEIDETYARANALAYQSQFGRAEELCEAILITAPSHVKALDLLGRLACRDNRLEKAVECFRRAARLAPMDFDMRLRLAETLRQAGLFEEARKEYEGILQANPQSNESLVGLGTIAFEAGEFSTAEQWFRRALEVDVSCPETSNNLGMALNEQGRWREALESFDHAIALRPTYAMAHSNRALVLLQSEQFAEGWNEYRWRWQCRTSAVARSNFKLPEWEGESLSGKMMLIHGEQGVGDEIMFASCYGDAIRAAKKCIIACDPRLLPLFQRSFPAATFHAVKRGAEQHWIPPEIAMIDVHLPSGCLPRFFRREATDYLQARRPFLQPYTEAVKFWRTRFAEIGSRPTIGVAWRGGRTPLDRKLRSTTLEQWREILKLPAEFINLQYDDCGDEVDDAGRRLGVRIHRFDEVNLTRDLDTLAAQTKALDLVISVGNAGVHMAGAIGTPCWALLPCHGAWRWGRERTESLWYSSVRLFRQKTPDSWDDVFQNVQTELLNYIRQFDDSDRRSVLRGPHSARSTRASRL